MTRPASISVVALASLIGTTIEWYDFFLYGPAAALVFNRLYFPNFDPLMGTLAAFGTYTVGFIARPIGGIVIGHYGDRIGRKLPCASHGGLIAVPERIQISEALLLILRRHVGPGIRLDRALVRANTKDVDVDADLVEHLLEEHAIAAVPVRRVL